MGIARDPKKNRPPIGARKLAQVFVISGTTTRGRIYRFQRNERATRKNKGGTARFFSPIHVAEFTKTISVAAANRHALAHLGPAAAALARAEGLTGHARALERRLGRH